MKINVGTPDRIARIVVGAFMPFLSGLALIANPVWLWVSVIAGAALIFTALDRFCSLYAILGLSTCKVPSR